MKASCEINHDHTTATELEVMLHAATHVQSWCRTTGVTYYVGLVDREHAAGTHGKSVRELLALELGDPAGLLRYTRIPAFIDMAQ